MKKHFITLLICGMFGYASAQNYSQRCMASSTFKTLFYLTMWSL